MHEKLITGYEGINFANVISVSDKKCLSSALLFWFNVLFDNVTKTKIKQNAYTNITASIIVFCSSSKYGNDRMIALQALRIPWHFPNSLQHSQPCIIIHIMHILPSMHYEYWRTFYKKCSQSFNEQQNPKNWWYNACNDLLTLKIATNSFLRHDLSRNTCLHIS